MHRGTTVGEAGATEEALQEAEHEESCEVSDERGGDSKNHEYRKGRYVDGIAADNRDLRSGREKERSNAIGQDIEGQR